MAKWSAVVFMISGMWLLCVLIFYLQTLSSTRQPFDFTLLSTIQLLRSRLLTNNCYSCTSSFNADIDYPAIAMLVESRSSALVITIVLNVMQHIPDTWPIQIFHGTKNKKFLENSSLSQFIKSGRIILTQYREYDGRKIKFQDDYLTNISFWKLVRGEKVLVFQTDSAMCSNSPHKITDYLQYDYVGAPWSVPPDGQLLGGNGAFSLRSRNKTITLLQRMTFPANSGIPEDVWFSQHLPTVGVLAPRHIAMTFSVEGVFYPNPMAVHKFYYSKDFNRTHLKKICAVCPEASLIPPYCKT